MYDNLIQFLERWRTNGVADLLDENDYIRAIGNGTRTEKYIKDLRHGRKEYLEWKERNKKCTII